MFKSLIFFIKNKKDKNCSSAGVHADYKMPQKKAKENIIMDKPMNYLEMVEHFMDMGMDEDTACREAYAFMYPDKYDPEDYE